MQDHALRCLVCRRWVLLHYLGDHAALHTAGPPPGMDEAGRRRFLREQAAFRRPVAGAKAALGPVSSLPAWLPEPSYNHLGPSVPRSEAFQYDRFPLFIAGKTQGPPTPPVRWLIGGGFNSLARREVMGDGAWDRVQYIEDRED